MKTHDHAVLLWFDVCVTNVNDLCVLMMLFGQLMCDLFFCIQTSSLNLTTHTVQLLNLVIKFNLNHTSLTK